MANPNRVNPWGRVFESSERGYFMGNRDFGKAWITCSLRTPNGSSTVEPVGYKKLFFLDEAVALAAGHRPCGQCRRKDYVLFNRLWKANETAPVDATLRLESIAAQAGRVESRRADKLPSGALFEREKKAYLAWQRIAYLWSPSGYSVVGLVKDFGTVQVLTLPSITRILEAGYRPWVHPSVLRT